MGERVAVLAVTPGRAVWASGQRVAGAVAVAGRAVSVSVVWRDHLAEAAEELVEELVDALRAQVPLLLVARRLRLVCHLRLGVQVLLRLALLA